MKKQLQKIGTILCFGIVSLFSNQVEAQNRGGVLPGAALNFDGVDDVVTVPYNSNLQLNQAPFTIELWAYPNIINTGFQYLISRDNTNGDMDFLMLLATNNHWAAYIRNTGNYVQSTNTVTPGTWYHIALTYDGTNMNLYINGILNATTAVTGTPVINSYDMHIGCRNESGLDAFYNGNLDEVRIWNVARTQCEINTYMNAEIATTATGLMANYHFNQGVVGANNSGVTSLIDNGGNALDGTLFNFVLTGSTSNWTAPGGVVSGNNAILPAPTPNIISSTGTANICGAGSTISLTAQNIQWTSVINGFSSQYTTGPWSANQILGAPNVFPTYNDLQNAWTVQSPGSGREWLQLGYAYPMPINFIDIYQTYSPGYIDTVYVKNPGTGNWDMVYSAPSASIVLTDVILHVTFPTTSYNVSEIRLAINNTNPINYIEIDAVGIGNSNDVTTSYVWSSGGTPSNTITGNPYNDTTYTVTATNIAGCIATATFSLYVKSLPTVGAYANVDPICAGGTQILYGTGAHSYVWDNGVTDFVQFTAPAGPTLYHVTGTDDNGCVDTATFSYVINPLPVLSLTFSSGDIVCSSIPSVNLIGLPAGGIYGGNTVNDSVFFPGVAGVGIDSMYYSYTDNNGCATYTAHAIEVDLCTGISQAAIDNTISVYPNPSTGMFTVESSTKIQLVITNVLGETIMTEQMEAGKHNFNLQSQSSGVYFAKVISDEKQQLIRLIKE